MRLALLWFDPKMGPEIFQAIPNELDDSEVDSLRQAMDIAQTGFFELENEYINSASYAFEIKSEISRGNREMLMFSVLAEKEIQDLGKFEKILKKHADMFIKSADLYHGFYKDYKKDSKIVDEKYSKIKVLLRELYKECEHQEKKMKIGNIFILGLDRVGKTPIIKRLHEDEDDIQEVGKLGKSVIRIVFENTDLDIYDIGGHNEIEELWELNPDPPEAVVYVVRLSADTGQHENAKKEFDRIMKFFFGEDAETILSPKTPVLILGSKIHQVESYNDTFLEELLHPSEYGINYKIGYVSAEEDVGIKENFRWIIEQFLQNL